MSVASEPWIVVVRGEAEGKEQRVALDFEDAESIFSSEGYAVSFSFIKHLLSLARQHDHWIIKTVIDDIRTPENVSISLTTPLFALLTRSRPRGLSAGALFIASTAAYPPSTPVISTNSATSSLELDSGDRYGLVALSPIGFAAACADDIRLFARFLTRLLKHPMAFEEVSILLPRSAAKLKTS